MLHYNDIRGLGWIGQPHTTGYTKGAQSGTPVKAGHVMASIARKRDDLSFVPAKGRAAGGFAVLILAALVLLTTGCSGVQIRNAAKTAEAQTGEYSL